MAAKRRWRKGKNTVFPVTVISQEKGEGTNMAERVYKTMKSVGAFNLVMGILLIVGGIAGGVAVIVNGAKLLNDKSDLTF
jgi:hypothetical protein